jgi:hypothetical protein
LFVVGCAGVQPFVFEGSTGAGTVTARVYGQRVVIAIGVDVVKDKGGEVVACPVAAVTLPTGQAVHGTHAGAHELCVAKYGVIGQ